MTPKNVFKASEVDIKAKGWIVDLSPDDRVDPDFYWYFPTKRDALKFRELVKNGVEARHAMRLVLYGA